MQESFDKAGVILMILSIALSLYINSLTSEAIFARSLIFIKDFKRDYDLEWFFKYGHYFVSTLSYCSVMFISLAVLDYSKVFVIVAAQGLGGMTFIAFEKMLIRAPRPFFVDPEIPIGLCKFAEFGSPSGHAFVAAICYFTTAAMMLKQFKASNTTCACVYMLLICPTVLYTCLARVFDGMHTFD